MAMISASDFRNGVTFEMDGKEMCIRDSHRGAHHASLSAGAHAGHSAVPVGDCGGGPGRI